jgi:hypothetical protein
MNRERNVRVSEAIVELEAALRDYLDHEATEHGVPREVSAESILGEASSWLTKTLIDHLPTIAGPWRVVDMVDGVPTRLVRDGLHGSIASVRRVGRKVQRWTAWVGDAGVFPDDSEHVDWASQEEAQAACDARLKADGVVIT